jgi:hypothetical protein
MVAHAVAPAIQEAEAGGSPASLGNTGDTFSAILVHWLMDWKVRRIWVQLLL